ncbi:glycoside hydrolase family 3 N-terminal domain-containing protein [Paenibacillus sp. FSL R7-0204]|uniref:glycoside hydrolase family 3 N-terminal domain-containing protein n=1 Tax=Paenibacillus sp. FSL R7-0204 TaxID=2921675 RepID=UPI0030FCEE0C
MIGTWHAIVETKIAKLKITFSIKDTNGEYSISAVVESFPVALDFDHVTVEGSGLRASGRAKSLQEGEAYLELIFSQNKFTGTLKLPTFGTLSLAGERGQGTSLTDLLEQELDQYRMTGVVERTEESIAAAVEQLLGQLSLQEKVGQMSQCLASDFSFGEEVASEPPEKLVAEGKAGSILGAFDINRVLELQRIAVEQSPHNIPLFFNADVIHGHQTIFPVPLAWSCSWDTEGIQRACAIAAKEASSAGITYNHGPMVDITRDPRWGRVVEGAGEDPYLGARIAEAQVRGFQGNSLFDQDTIIACLKHFIAYGAAEGGRDYNTVDISEGTLRNVHLPPFQAGIQAGAGSVMNAFNIYQGVPAAGSKFLMKDLLRNELGFDGILLSDYGAIEEISIHGCAEDEAEAARMALDATMDIEMVTRAFANQLPKLIGEGIVKEEQLDEAVRRILTYKYRIGIMDDPFRYIRPKKALECQFSEEHLQESRALARKSIVLLKNDGVLPLKASSGTVALIGPFARTKDLLGTWQFSRHGNATVTLEQGVTEAVSGRRVLIADGCAVDQPIDGGYEAALQVAEEADVIVLALGESSRMSGEAASRMNITLPEVQLKLAEEIAKLGKPTVLVLTNGRPLILDWFEHHVNAIVESWFLGSQAGHAIADVLFGQYNPSGKLTMSFPRHAGQIPVYYNHFNTGRPASPEKHFSSKYLDGSNDPLYPFGFGLSYTTFDYSEIKLDKHVLKRGDSLTVQVTIANTGQAQGEEIVQLYIQDICGSVVRPVKELKGFQKLCLCPGESREIRFVITEEDLKYYAADLTFKAETGDFKIYVGPNSRDVQEASFRLDN